MNNNLTEKLMRLFNSNNHSSLQIYLLTRIFDELSKMSQTGNMTDTQETLDILKIREAIHTINTTRIEETLHDEIKISIENKKNILNSEQIIDLMYDYRKIKKLVISITELECLLKVPITFKNGLSMLIEEKYKEGDLNVRNTGETKKSYT